MGIDWSPSCNLSETYVDAVTGLAHSCPHVCRRWLEFCRANCPEVFACLQQHSAGSQTSPAQDHQPTPSPPGHSILGPTDTATAWHPFQSPVTIAGLTVALVSVLVIILWVVSYIYNISLCRKKDVDSQYKTKNVKCEGGTSDYIGCADCPREELLLGDQDAYVDVRSSSRTKDKTVIDTDGMVVEQEYNPAEPVYFLPSGSFVPHASMQRISATGSSNHHNGAAIHQQAIWSPG